MSLLHTIRQLVLVYAISWAIAVCFLELTGPNEYVEHQNLLCGNPCQFCKLEPDRLRSKQIAAILHR